MSATSLNFVRRLGVLAGPAWFVYVFATTAAVSIVVAVNGLRGVDVPAQLFRVELFDLAGFTVWSPQWYAGHHTPLYSVLFPPLAHVFGLASVGAAVTIASVAVFGRLVRGRGEVAAALATSVFAVAMVGNLVVGRITFALGLVFALLAVAALVRRTPAFDLLAILAGIACALASPLAAASLAVVAGGWWLVERRTPIAAVAAATPLPVAVLGWFFPEGGTFPFTVPSLGFHLGACLAVAAVASGMPVVRVAALATAAAAIPLFVVPNPVGGNFTRLAMLAAPAILAWFLLPGRILLFLVLAGPIIGWQVAPVITSLDGVADPSAERAYHEPLIKWFEKEGLSNARVEIPVTRDHWEAAYVAPMVPLVRGWERQLDFKWDNVFYDDEQPLNPETYRQWLDENAVHYVALPDTPLDSSSEVEAAMLTRGLPYLTIAWLGEHWTVWKVTEPVPIVDGPAKLVDLGPDRIVLDVRRPGDMVLRVHRSPHMVVSDEAGCVGGTDDGWTRVHALRAGRLEITTTVAPDRTPTCPGF